MRRRTSPKREERDVKTRGAEEKEKRGGGMGEEGGKGTREKSDSREGIEVTKGK